MGLIGSFPNTISAGLNVQTAGSMSPTALVIDIQSVENLLSIYPITMHWSIAKTNVIKQLINYQGSVTDQTILNIISQLQPIMP